MTISFFVYFTAFFIMQGQEQFEADIEFIEESATEEQSQQSAQADYESGGTDFLSILGSIGGFLFLQSLGIPYPLNVIMGFVAGIMLTIIVVIAISVIYDFVKALPFT